MSNAALTGVRLRARALPRDAASVATILRLGVLACSILSIAAFLGAAVLRLSYPFPLQVTEAAALSEVQRILMGQPVYVAPTLQHIPLTYGPVFFYLAAAAASLLGLSYLPLRLVSLAASVGSLGLIGYLVLRETRSRTAALAGAGLFAAAFPFAETALDLGRVDALFVFFLLAAIAVARRATSWWAVGASGVALALAGLTKLPLGALPVGLALTLYLAATVRRRVAAFVLGTTLTMGLVVLGLRLQSGPWPTWYMWDLPGQHAINDHGDLLGRFWFVDILPRFTFALVLGPLFVLLRWVRGDQRPFYFYGLIGASLAGLAWAARSNSGGAPNVLLPMVAIVAVLFGLGVSLAQRELAAARTWPGAPSVRAYLLGLCIVQFALLAYNPRLLVPYRSEQWASDRLATTLASLPGPLFAPDLDAYLRASDKGEQPHLGALGELTGGYGGLPTDEGRRWLADLDTALKQHRYSHVVVDQPCCEIKKALDANGYIDSGPLFPPDDDYWLWTTGRSPGGIRVFVPPS